jgi:signal transduction histidine kinase
MSAARLLVWLAGGVLSATMIFGAIHNHVLPADEAAAGYGAAFVAVTIGVVAWRVRPESRTGLLLAAIPFVGMLSDLSHVFQTSRVGVTIGLGASWLAAPLIAQVVLSYPSGRLSARLDRIVVATAWLLAAAYGLVFMLFYSPRSPVNEEIWSCPWCAIPYSHFAWLNLIGFDRDFNRVVLVLALVLLALLVRKLVRSSPGGRRVVLPLAVAGSFIVVEFTVQMILYGHPVNSWTHPTWFWIVQVAMLSVPVALALGLIWEGGGSGALAGLVVALERTPPGAVRDALARTLGDPSLELALWLPERNCYVDATGAPVMLPSPDSGRAVTTLGSADAPVAALVHDPVLLERRGLLAAAGAAAGLALENERLQAELRAQLAELRASRARIVTAGDEERRRLERDLHDGAQQRLLALSYDLRLARAGAEAEGDVETASLLMEATGHAQSALSELRELAHGIHPAILTEAGLTPALATLADAAPSVVEIGETAGERYPAPVETAAYLVVAEAIDDAARRGASYAVVSAPRHDYRVVVKVDDDGSERTFTMIHLADRVGAIGGRLEVGPTTLRAEIPCA